MDMPIPTPSPYSDDSEGPVLRNFVDESIAQERKFTSPRSEPRAVADSVDPGTSRRGGRNSHEPQPFNELVNSDGSPNELLRLITKQKQEIHTLRRALQTAAQRVNHEAQRAVSLERSKTTEHFRFLNENRLAAQQDAMKANSELRLYQFQLQHAQREMTRAQELLKTVEGQRDDAEEAAARARLKARKYLQERMVAAAREEGRRLGFEAGLQRAQEEQGLYTTQESGRNTHNRSRLVPGQADSTRGHEIATNEDIFNDAVDEMNQLSLSAHRVRPDQSQNTPPELTRTEQTFEPKQPFYPPHQYRAATESEVLQNTSPPPPEPVPIVYPTPDPLRPKTPAVQVYELDIPPAAEIERQNSLNQYPGKRPQQWVTAEQYHDITGQPVSPHDLQFNTGNVDLQRGDYTLNTPTKPGKRKESWYRTLSRRFRRKKLERQENGPTARPASWYTPAPDTAPPVLVRDFGIPQPQPLADSVSVSTHLSQLDIVSKTPNGSEASLRPSTKARRRFREKGRLFVINEDLAGRAIPPVKHDMSRNSPNAGPDQATLPSSMRRDSGYSDSRTMEEWRRSSTSGPREAMQAPRGPRRPAHLTVPAPLGFESANPLTSFQMHTPQNSREPQDNRPELYRHGTSSDMSPIKIKVEGPSRSPSDALGSGRTESNYLSPNRVAGDLPSLPSLSAMLYDPPSFSNTRSMPDAYEARTSYELEASQSQSHFPGHRASSVAPSVPQNRSRPGSVASHTHKQALASPSNRVSRPLPPDQPASYQWPAENYDSRSLSRPTPKLANQPLPHMSSGGDKASVRSGRRSGGHPTPHQSSRDLPAAGGGGWGGTARSDGSHRRAISETHLTPGPSSVRLLPAEGEKSLHRISSNLSMKSNASRYVKYVEADYADPAYFPPESAGPTWADKGKGVDRPHSRPRSEVSSKR